MRLSWFLFVSGTLLRCTSALEPWFFTWTDPSGKNHSESSSTSDICKTINNPVGKHYEWTSSDGWCIYFWENTNCTGTTTGQTCKSWPWRQDAGSHIQSFKAVLNDSDVTDTSDTANTNKANISNAGINNVVDNNNGKSLSGGAIAGIVIGVVAGVVILATVAWFFLFYLRRQKKASALGSSMKSAPSEPGDAAVGAGSVSQNPAFPTFAEMPGTQKEMPGELMNNNIVEVSDSQRTVELDATETVRGQR